MNISINGTDFLAAFDLIMETEIDNYKRDHLHLYTLKICSNEFNYAALEETLIDPVVDYALSREVKKQYSGKPATLSKKARDKFKDSVKNDGELGELLLFCFLEAQLKAPKILSKMELKTSTSLYVNGADGVHFRKIDEDNYQLIFGESKMYKSFMDAVDNALNSISEFKKGINNKGDKKSGLKYEKSLISDNLSKETFSEEEKEFIKSLIYPNSKSKFNVDDAFGVFIGFEVDVTGAEKALPNNDFRKLIQDKVKSMVENRLPKINKR